MDDTQKPVDWEAVELDYRAGLLTLRQIGERHGISAGRISQKAKKEGWTRDLGPKIKAKADAKLATDAVVLLFPDKTDAQAVREAEVVEANATAIADVVRGQRRDIQRYRALCNGLLAEVEHQTEHRELYLQLGELLKAPDQNGVDKLNDLYKRVVALPQRVESAKKLIESLRILVSLEREAFNITGSTDDAIRQQNDNAPAMSAQEAYMKMIGK